MATDEYIGALRSWAYDNFDPISGLNYSQLLEWEHRHLEYWGGQLEVRPELPISILSTNLIGTVTMKNNFSLRLAIYCSQTETFTVYLNDGETVNDIATNSWYWWGYAIGRCGEFALLYNGLLLANGYQSRIVVDCSFQTDDRVTGDHVWNEIWINNTWIHIDPTEGIINDPTMYSNPERWNKNVNLVYAIQGNVITDVTEIYRWK